MTDLTIRLLINDYQGISLSQPLKSSDYIAGESFRIASR